MANIQIAYALDCPTYFHTHVKTAEQKTLPNSLLWKVTGFGGTESYVFGTYHSDKPKVAAKADRVRAVFPYVKVVALELLDNDIRGEASFAQAMRLSEGQHLQQLLGTELFFDVTLALNDYGITALNAGQLKPWAVAVILDMTPEEFRDSGTLDGLIEAAARGAGKQVIALETAQEQIAMFDSLPLKQQIESVRLAVSLIDQRADLEAEMHALYINEDLQGLQDYSDRMLAAYGDDVTRDWVTQQLITKRNHVMLERMRDQLAEGGLLVAVGALHLPGEQGLLPLLEKQGYCVSPVGDDAMSR